MPRYRIGFVMEQVLGHVTHDRYLRRRVDEDPDIDAEWLAVRPSAPDIWQNMPVVGGNWTLLASVRAAELVAAARSRGPLDLLYYHTQVPSLGGLPLMARIPAVLSLDATPVNMDGMAAAYGHAVGSPGTERLKMGVYRHLFARAAHLVAQSLWVAGSLRDDYGVPEPKISVIRPGINAFPPPAARTRRPGDPVRLLFIGGDFRRKGGPLLLEVLDSLPGPRRWVLDIVTHDPVDLSGRPWARLVKGLAPASPELAAAYASADVFVLPTNADTMGMAFMEAMAAGLPIVACRVGAVGEVVRHGQTGLLTAPGDGAGLAEALAAVIDRPELRLRLGEAGRRLAAEEFDAVANNRRLLKLLKSVVDRRRGRTPASAADAVAV
jgi:glycosyltransferase involved in cell wall biosynthesis